MFAKCCGLATIVAWEPPWLWPNPLRRAGYELTDLTLLLAPLIHQRISRSREFGAEARLSSRSSTTHPLRDQTRLFPANRDRQAVYRLHAGPFAPCNFRFIHRERQCGPTLEQRFQRASTFNTCELMAEAEMDSGAEGDVPVRSAL